MRALCKTRDESRSDDIFTTTPHRELEVLETITDAEGMVEDAETQDLDGPFPRSEHKSPAVSFGGSRDRLCRPTSRAATPHPQANLRCIGSFLSISHTGITDAYPESHKALVHAYAERHLASSRDV